MGNDKALLLFHDARIHFLESLGFSEGNIGGPGLIMTEAHVYFKKELFRGDKVKIYTQLENLTSIAFELHYAVFIGENEAILGHTKMLCFDYERRKIARIPDTFLEALNS